MDTSLLRPLTLSPDCDPNNKVQL